MMLEMIGWKENYKVILENYFIMSLYINVFGRFQGDENKY